MLGIGMAVPGSGVLLPRFGNMFVGERKSDVLGPSGETAA